MEATSIRSEGQRENESFNRFHEYFQKCFDLVKSESGWNISLSDTVITCELEMNCSHYKVLLGTDKHIFLLSSLKLC